MQHGMQEMQQQIAMIRMQTPMAPEPETMIYALPLQQKYQQ